MSDNAHRLWLGARPLILASASRTRAALLVGAGLVPESIRPDVEERRIEADAGDLAPIDLAIRLAEAKAEDVAGRHPDRVTVGADQVLEIDGTVLHKPADLREAADHLARLQGRTHALHSAVALVAGGTTETFCETARLTMRPLDHGAIAAYLALAGTERVTSSVGGYQLEGLGIHLFSRIDGDHATVLGLPLIPLLARLRGRGLLAIR
ncbi:Maf family protein [Methylobacterium haplocladii]|uniref:Nucleoside triphosphate pyrophosphatase n=1 Tax=Methylobacterium haplocladii TaxID=1176176 RepID=A0A512IKU8_9HYPH|nr:Maf family protein [Methylobacterium haplocladii]GEO98347.1 Maf-like protein [Methylobacterium haplocladii]GJD82975.1 dTTP/UTP pyrophosphatase [Methylobacterium haplocladii]GLS58740.1 Maf-like protein [Methylobacterium haplocladii]